MGKRDPSHILDACIAIDLINGNLVEAVDELPFTIGIPDVILQMELNTYKEFNSGKFSFLSIGFSETQIGQVYQLRIKSKKISTPDLFAFLGAQHYSCCLLTGDNNLRDFSESEGITVHGVLWLLDELIYHNLITPNEASESLYMILQKNSYLPNNECAKRFIEWGAPKEYMKIL